MGRVDHIKKKGICASEKNHESVSRMFNLPFFSLNTLPASGPRCNVVGMKKTRRLESYPIDRQVLQKQKGFSLLENLYFFGAAAAPLPFACGAADGLTMAFCKAGKDCSRTYVNTFLKR